MAVVIGCDDEERDFEGVCCRERRIARLLGEIKYVDHRQRSQRENVIGHWV